MKVEVVCTTDDPSDDLGYHKKMQGSFDILILPTFRRIM
jgi:glucuronate isomerase